MAPLYVCIVDTDTVCARSAVWWVSILVLVVGLHWVGFRIFEMIFVVNPRNIKAIACSSIQEMSNPAVVSPPVLTALMILVWKPELRRVPPGRMPARNYEIVHQLLSLEGLFTCSTETLMSNRALRKYIHLVSQLVGEWHGPLPHYCSVPRSFYGSIYGPKWLLPAQLVPVPCPQCPTGWPWSHQPIQSPDRYATQPHFSVEHISEHWGVIQLS